MIYLLFVTIFINSCAGSEFTASNALLELASQAPASTPVPTVTVTSTPVPTVTVTSTPVPTITVTSTPVPTVTGSPVISAVSPSGSQFLIAGTNFGQKTFALPVLYDNFESGTINQNISGQAPAASRDGNLRWRQYQSGPNAPHYSANVLRPNSNRSSRHVFGGASYNVSLELLNDVLNTGDEVYFSFWRHHNRTSTSWSRNVKPWMVWGSSGSTPVAYNGWGGSSDNEFRNSVQDSGLSSPTLWGGPQLFDIENEWVRIEVYLKQSSPTAANGAFQVWIDNDQVQSNTNYQTRSSNNYWRQWHFGSYHATDTPADATAQVYLDDIYFDRTRARVELCDSNVWSTRTHCEVQVTTEWESNEILINLIQGAFADGATAYLFVIDSNGRVSNSRSILVGQ